MIKKNFSIIVVLVLATLLLGCSTPDELESKTDLNIRINEAIELKTNTGVGSEPGQVKLVDLELLQTAINTAEEVYNDDEASVEEVVAATKTLEEAVTLLKGSVISGDTQLDRAGWVGIASNNGNHAGTALDNDYSTRWHGSYQEVGKWFELDMQSNQTFNLITLWDEPSPADLPRGFEVYVAVDGEEAEYGKAVYSGGFPQDHPGGIGEISLSSPQTARWVKIVLTAEDTTKYFAIHEIYVGNRY